VTESRNEEGIDLGSHTLGSAISSLHGSDAETVANAVAEVVLNHVSDDDNLDDDVTLLIVTRSAAA
jgi:serine phosphatase RsbU (regulator of sigma subunit)